MDAIIRLRDLRKAFGRREVLRGIDLTVRRGTVHALLGPNGAGKTTLVSVLSTLVVPDGGTATVCDLDVVHDARAVTRSISLTGQSAAVDEVLTTDENLLMVARLLGLRGRAARTRVDALLAQFDLVGARRQRAKALSGGTRRRLDLALGLVVVPPVVLLDEPTTGLDPRSRQAVWSAVRTLADAGTTVLLTTQYLEEADRLVDRVAVLDGGRIVAEGTPAELKARVGDEVVELTDAAGAVLASATTDGTTEGVRRALATLPDVAGATVGIRRPTMDDVFLALTGQGASAIERESEAA